MPDDFPHNSVHQLLQSDRVTPATKKVLEERLQVKERITPHFFSDEDFHLLEAVCDRLFPQEERDAKIPLAIMFERSLTEDAGKGWRYDELPPMETTIVSGLRGIQEEATLLFHQSFIEINNINKEDILRAVQNEKGQAVVWQKLNSPLFFEELLAALTELYYSHPIAKDEIGEMAFADARGWEHIGLYPPEDHTTTPPHARD